MIDLLKIETDPHQLYHVSPKQFDWPSRDAIFAAREWSRWHANGVLGLWCSTFPNMCASFGKHTYRVNMKECRKVGLQFDQFFKLTRDREDFTDVIAFLCEHADIAYVVDSNPCVGEVIVLNFDRIETFTEVTGTPLDDVHIPLRALVAATNEKA